MEEKDIPMVVYSLSQPIRSQILNYKKFVKKELDLETFFKIRNLLHAIAKIILENFSMNTVGMF